MFRIFSRQSRENVMNTYTLTRVSQILVRGDAVYRLYQYGRKTSGMMRDKGLVIEYGRFKSVSVLRFRRESRSRRFQSRRASRAGGMR